MFKEDIEKLEEALSNRGYKKITSCKANLDDDFEYYKSLNDKDGNHTYQIFYEFWDFTKYGGSDWGVSVTIIPESCENNIGRRDLALSVDWVNNIDKVEETAKRFYKFIKKIDVL